MIASLPIAAIRPSNPTSMGEMRQWLESHNCVKAWLSESTDVTEEATLMIQAFMGWIDTYRAERLDSESQLQECERKIAATNNVPVSMVWLYCIHEWLEFEEMFDLVKEAAEIFDNQVGHCLVYHPNKYIENVRLISLAMSRRAEEISRPRALELMSLNIQDDVSSPREPDAEMDTLSQSSECSDISQQEAQASCVELSE